MADANVGDIYTVTFRSTLAGQTVLSLFSYRLTTMDGAPTVDSIYNGLNTVLVGTASRLKDRYRDLIPSNMIIVDARYQRVASQRIDAKLFSINQLGNYGFDATTANLAGVIMRRGELANRKNVSTLHVPYPDKETGLGGGLVTTNWKTVASALQTQLLATVTIPTTTTVLTPCIFNRGSVPNFATLTRTEAKDQLRVMRRRTVGLGI
jgi:hypothetical protein